MIDLDKTVVVMDEKTFEIIPHVPPEWVSEYNELIHKIKL